MSERFAGDSPAAPDGRFAGEEEKIESIVEEYTRRLVAGQLPDPYELMLLHLPIARELEERLKIVELLHGTRAGVTIQAPVAIPARGNNSLQTVGRYEIRERLGVGESAVVYRAWDSKYEREVALKILRAEAMENRTARERFEREAPIVARLRHPHIVPLHESGEADGLRYLDTELVDGETLQQRLAREPLVTRRAAVEWVAKLALALDYAHAQGIVHRDVKPSNILIDRQGEPQLTDFGMARRSDAARSLTCAGALVGTPAYMAPEQAASQSPVDGRTDVYSLGVLLYELLTGRRPFHRSDDLGALLFEIVHCDPPSPRQFDPTIPRALATICLKALEKSPADRFQTAGHMADELRRWLNDEPSLIQPPSMLDRARRWARRNQLSAWTIIAATVLVTSFSVVAYWKHMQGLLHAQAEAQVRVAALHDAATQRLRQPTEGRRRESLELLRETAKYRERVPRGPAANELDLKTRSLLAWTLATPELVTTQVAQFPGVWHRAWPVAIHPRGDCVAIGTNQHPFVWRRGESLRRPPDLTDAVAGSRLIFSPDGKLLLVAPDDGGVQAWTSEASDRLGEWKNDPASPSLAFGFESGLRAVVVACTDGRVQRLSLPNLEALGAWPREYESTVWTAAAFNARATKAARGNADGRVELHDAEGRKMLTLAADSTLIEALAWSPDEHSIAVGSRSGVVRLYDVETGQPSHSFQVGITGVGSIIFSPDGRWLLAGQRGTTTKVWDLATRRQVLTGPGPPSSALAADGQTFAAAGPAYVAFCTLSPAEVIRDYSGHGNDVQQLVWSDDSQRLATIDTGFQIHVWNLTSRAPIFSVRAPSEDLYAHQSNAGLALSSDGRLLAYASGGKKRSHLLIRDLESGAVVWEGILRGAYEHLVPGGADEFILAREEIDDDGGGLQTVIYRWPAGEPPTRLKVLRPCVPGEQGFVEGELTRGGTYYVWSGPRTPYANHRTEVLEIATGHVRRFPQIGQPASDNTCFCVTEDGTHLWTGNPGAIEYFDLRSGVRKGVLDLLPAFVSRDARWLVSHSVKQYLCRDGDQNRWLQFPDYDDLRYSQGLAFSPDCIYLGWGTPSGSVRVVELAELQRRLRELQPPGFAP